MSWASFYKNFMGINLTKCSWANYYKNACVNKVSKMSPLYWHVHYKLLNFRCRTLHIIITNWMCMLRCIHGLSLQSEMDCLHYKLFFCGITNLTYATRLIFASQQGQKIYKYISSKRVANLSAMNHLCISFFHFALEGPCFLHIGSHVVRISLA
jgi:hypothetical protein